MEEDNNKIFNPFEGRDPDEVWKEIAKMKKVRVTREEAFRQMREFSEKQKRDREGRK